MSEERTRIIYYGDNLDILREHVGSESVDLVYLDPPFKSQQEYNVLFRTVKGEPAAAQAKSGHVGPRDVRDLRGTMERERAPFALLITLVPPTEAMKRDATEAGFYTVEATAEQIPRLQIITVGELLRGLRPRLPTTRVAPVPQAPRIRKRAAVQAPLGLDG